MKTTLIPEKNITQSRSILTTLSVRGTSMAPLIKTSSKLEIEINKEISYKTGDIVIFIYNGKLHAHRIIKVVEKKYELGYMLKGDNNYKIDGIFKNNQIIGKVTRIIDLKYVIDLNSRKNYIVKHLFVFYSVLLMRFPALGKSKDLYIFRPFKFIYYLLIRKF